MGQRAERLMRFLTENPTCCFCGGIAPAVTEDHVPSRGIFLNRQWPLGYSFPACLSCNDSTRHEEKIVSMLSRLDPFNEPTQEEEAESNKAISAVRAAYPELAKEMLPSANQIRRALKSMNLGALKNQVQHYSERMLHGENLQSVEY